MEIKVEQGDITKLAVEAIVNPANSEGEMGGGVAAVIKKKGGKKIEEEAMARAPVAIGEAIITTAGKLPCNYVIHAPTMVVPAQRTTLEKIKQATQAALKVANDYGIKSLAMPGMGTGTGRVPLHEAARAMIEVIKNFPSQSVQELVLIDKKVAMVIAWKQALQNQPTER
ncbi:MAG: macro domain-containing protein [Calditrichaeota bacterium]|nr:MAG: macro domain-containing protein [Calditrichota bacterium]